MEFVGMLLINVFLGVIFYLIITLKLEKSASDFREKKLWAEMDKMIQEFNATAERNISILEKKIRIMRALLEKSGELKKIDYTIDDEDAEDGEITAPQNAVAAAGAAPAVKARGDDVRNDTPEPAAPAAPKKIGPLLVEALFAIIDGIVFFFGSLRDGFAERRNRSRAASMGRAEQIGSADRGGGVAVIEKDFDEIGSKIVSQNEKTVEHDRPTEDDIMMIINDGKDKHSTVSLLHRKGCADEEISHYMRIPVGEVRLILNLTESI